MAVPTRRHFSVRKVAILASIAIIATTGIACIYKDSFENPNVIYTLQVLSGNWPGKTTDVDEYYFIVGSIFAVLLNTAAIAGIVTGAYGLAIIRGYTRMNIRNAFNIRDQIALQGIMAKIQPMLSDLLEEKLTSMKDEIWKCFQAADTKWEKDFIPVVMPGKSGSDFINTINGNEPR